MEILWQDSTFLSVRDVLFRLRATHSRRSAYTTVMTVLSRLHKKGVVRRTWRGRGFCYTASSSKEVFLRTASKDILKNFSRDFGHAAVAYFFDAITDTQETAIAPSVDTDRKFL